ncbi:acyltransferase family protein [Nocardioides litoris]|uniref:acyltransferase family protein n=1 Tax=Nocardioides litoris TaxID=1926648 RepID=UPI001B8733E8|nr:acyltransferase [Nocardioides litoris]
MTGASPVTAEAGPRRVGAIDLLRGVAVGLVMLRHALPEVFPGAGVVGVVAFFALSGYLITGVLAAELDRAGRVDLGRFYRRRALRLVPALLVLVVGVVLVTLLLDPLDDRDELGRTVVVALTWTANLPPDHGSDATFHLWTLATEEQFYLVWPALLALAWTRRRVPALLALAALGGLAAAGLTVAWLHEDPDLAYALPTSWATCFVVGAAARLLGHRVPTARATPFVLPGLALLGVLSVLPLRGHATTYLVAAPAVALVTAGLLLAWREWYDVRPVALRGLVALGTVSYAAYLWNYPLTVWLRPHLGGPEVAGLLAVPLTLLAAVASTRLVEEPLLRRASRRASRRAAGAARAEVAR